MQLVDSSAPLSQQHSWEDVIKFTSLKGNVIMEIIGQTAFNSIDQSQKNELKQGKSANSLATVTILKKHILKMNFKMYSTSGI